MWSIESTQDATRHQTKGVAGRTLNVEPSSRPVLCVCVAGFQLRDEVFGAQWSRVHTDWKALQHVDRVILTNALADTDRDMMN